MTPMVAAALVFIGILIGSQMPASQTPSGSITVIVRDAASGIPVAGLEVAVEKAGASAITAITESGGTADFADLAAGTYIVKVTNKNQLEPDSETASLKVLGSRKAVIKPGAATAVEFSIRRPATLRGQVLTEEGRPVASVPIEVLTVLRTFRGRPVLTAALTNGTGSATDGEGRFVVADLNPGRYFLRIAMPSIDDVPLNDVYAPGVISTAGAVPINLESGDDVTIGIRAIAVPGVGVEGRVVDHSGQPVEGAHIKLRSLDRSSDDSGGEQITSNAGGQFVLKGVRSGLYALHAVARTDANSPVTLVGAAEVDVGEKSVGPIEVTVVPGALVAGRVFFNGAEQSQRGRAAIAVKAEGDDADVREGLAPAPEWRADGSFTFSGVLGRHRLTLQATATSFIERAFLEDGTDIADGAFNFEAGRVYPKVRVMLSDETAEITGKLPKGVEASPLAIVAFPEDSSLWSDGRYIRVANASSPQTEIVIKGVPPGRNYFVAILGLPELPRIPAEFLETLVPGATRVFIGEPGKFTVNLSDPNRNR